MRSAALSSKVVRLEPSDLPPFNEFLDTFKDTLRNVFHVRGNADTFSLQRGLPPFALRDIMACNPLSVGIPTKFGGRGGRVHENLALLSASTYESLALGLTFGINWALFLQPVAKYAQESVKAPIFRRFTEERAMGGLMITEPDYGTDALNMQTSFRDRGDHYHLQGTKHWGGLTGWADYWLVTAREATDERGLKRDISFFVSDSGDPAQQIEVEEVYENLGLYMIPYGRNKVDIRVPHLQRLEPRSTGVKMMLDLLHRSRMQFPGMATGFIKRLLDEGLNHARQRVIGAKPLIELDQVQERLARLQTSFTICSAMCAYSSKHAHAELDVSGCGLEANAIKTVSTDLMHEASQSLLQLVGATGYRLDHIAGRATVDSRPFQIFEGSNDVLYSQISERVLKLMRSAKQTNLLTFLSEFGPTRKAADFVREQLDFSVSSQLSQRKLVDLGKILGRVMSVEHTLDLGEQGFRQDLITNSVERLKQDITGLISVFRVPQQATVVEDYEEQGDWLKLLT